MFSKTIRLTIAVILGLVVSSSWGCAPTDDQPRSPADGSTTNSQMGDAHDHDGDTHDGDAHNGDGHDHDGKDHDNDDDGNP